MDLGRARVVASLCGVALAVQLPRNMKITSLLGVLFAGLLFLGCGGSSSSAPDPGATAADSDCANSCSKGDIVNCLGYVVQPCPNGCGYDGVGDPYCGEQVQGGCDPICQDGILFNCQGGVIAYSCN
jgi:hypothetical protein